LRFFAAGRRSESPHNLAFAAPAPDRGQQAAAQGTLRHERHAVFVALQRQIDRSARFPGTDVQRGFHV
jgi:hypothetical protein